MAVGLMMLSSVRIVSSSSSGFHREGGSRIDKEIDPTHESRRVFPSVQEISICFFSSFRLRVLFTESRHPCDFRFRSPEDLLSREMRCRSIRVPCTIAAILNSQQDSRFALEMNIRARHRSLCDSLGLLQVLAEG